uniref:Kinesin motor domain-containing protein n=1 Tax=viral metagenome TaxID=1070528 RepID=A0A6C0H6W7_9ZZZZ
MEAQSIVEYIKQTYPKVVFKPIKFSYKNALGFVVTGDKVIIGFINKSGNLCKVAEPINLSEISNDNIVDVLSKIPIVNGFTDKDRERLLRLFQRTDKEKTITRREHNALVQELEQQLQESNTKQSEYKILYDSESNKVIAVQKEYEEKIEQIKQQFEARLQEYEQAKNKLIEERDQIRGDLGRFQTDMKEFVRTNELKVEDLQGIQKKLTEERDLLQNRISEIIQAEQAKQAELAANQEMLSNHTELMNRKETELIELQKSLAVVNQDLEQLKITLRTSELQREALEGYKSRCQDKLLSEKDEIISKIKEYNQRWQEWARGVESNFEEYKRKLINDLKKVSSSLDVMLAKRNELDQKEKTKLKQNIKDIQAELQRTVSEQLIRLNEKDEQIRMLQSAGVGFDVRDGNEVSSYDTLQQELQESQAQIERLKAELEQVRSLLAQNNATKVQATIDYDNCYAIVQNFFSLNNIFYRKQEIIGRLENVITNGIGNFINLNESVKQDIRARFEKLKVGINKHIQFLDLERYINSEDFRYLKSKSTRNKVSPKFCADLNTILDYWNENKAEYREQDRQLTNIYEDLSGAVRVYVRIKPLIGLEQKEKTVSIGVSNNQKQKRIVLNCENVPGIKNNIRKEFGEFYGVFDETFTNEEVYTGVQGIAVDFKTFKIDIDSIIESSESVSPGLYSTFQQVEDGYSIVIFGYGLSGSGKTYSILGMNNRPGLIHYGLANLRGVKNIKLKYLFEQYFGAVNVNFGKITGKIHNLINEVPQMTKFAKDERADFAERIPSDLNVDNIKVRDIYRLTDIIEQYRISHGRIKKTPNNPVSSRSHLYFVFEVTFETGRKGYITLVDTAGRESPLEIFNIFLDPSKAKLASIMAPPPVGGESGVEKVRRPELDPFYTSKHIFEVLKEGFYINETINHLLYFFNKKNYRQTKITLQHSELAKYTISNYYVDPKDEEKGVDISNNCLMIPIMSFLDTLSNRKKSEFDYKPTKFIMMCMVRQEERYCDQIFDTLDFAQNVKST